MKKQNKLSLNNICKNKKYLWVCIMYRKTIFNISNRCKIKKFVYHWNCSKIDVIKIRKITNEIFLFYSYVICSVVFLLPLHVYCSEFSHDFSVLYSIDVEVRARRASSNAAAFSLHRSRILRRSSSQLGGKKLNDDICGWNDIDDITVSFCI